MNYFVLERRGIKQLKEYDVSWNFIIEIMRWSDQDVEDRWSNIDQFLHVSDHKKDPRGQKEDGKPELKHKTISLSE